MPRYRIITTMLVAAAYSLDMGCVTIREKIGLSYDDVLLVPNYSQAQSRSDISTKTRLTKNISLNIPLVSSNMDSVTEAPMAIAMAQLGGFGIIHRFNTIAQQVKEVQEVKRFRNAIIEDPFVISHRATYGEAKDMMATHKVKGLLVVDDSKKIAGILTNRDVRFRPDEKTPIKELMTPRERLVVEKKTINVEKAKQILLKHGIEKLPLINEDDTIAGLITSKDIFNKTQNPLAVVDKKGRLMVGAAIGVKDDSLERAEKLVAAGADVLVIDVAHGHSKASIEMLKALKNKMPDVEVIAGNVATAQGAKDLIEAGADAIKVGVGPGSICTTRLVTGSGFPQLSAIIECAQEADKHNVPIIADGGIKQSGDITKAIAAGASSVMLGNMLAGTEESPGMPLIKDGHKCKVIRGMASFGANLARNDQNKKEEYVPEGVEALIQYRGSVAEVVHLLMGGLRSGLSYCGANSLEQARGKGEFIQITPSGMRESAAHDVTKI